MIQEEISVELFHKFNRHQEVNRCWRKEDGVWVLKDISFVEEWGEPEKQKLTACLKNTAATGGVVLGAFLDNTLVGFTSLENSFFGSSSEYLQLSCIHTSYESRNMGIGKELFKLICGYAKQAGARKLYISAHSSEESQAFYKALGCVEAKEYNKHLVEEEPFDCQLEYLL